MDNMAYLIPVVVLVGGFTFATLTVYFKSRERIAALAGGADAHEALAANTELNEALAVHAELNERLLAKLDSLDSRLSGIERTLNEVG